MPPRPSTTKSPAPKGPATARAKRPGKGAAPEQVETTAATGTIATERPETPEAPPAERPMLGGDPGPRRPERNAGGELSVEIRGARTHNLKNVSVDIPHGKLTVITGLSGSGKSSLAFDTLFAEGQRRFVESMSTYARQFLQKMPRPDVDAIHNIQPAIALEQKNAVTNARSTVGTATELNDYLRLLYARCAEIVCPDCQVTVRQHSPQTAAHELCQRLPGARLLVLAPVKLEAARLADPLRQQLTAQGFFRLWWRGEVAELADLPLEDLADATQWEVVIDRVVLPARGEEEPARLAQATATAFRVGQGQLLARVAPREGEVPDPAPLILFEGLRCDSCGRAFREPEPALFSFYSPLGACKVCEGMGRTIGIDWAKCIPNHALSIEDGAIAVWNTPGNSTLLTDFKKGARKHGIGLHVPYHALTPAQQEMVREGAPGMPGLRHFFRELEEQKYKVQARITLARYRAYERCTACQGSRLVADALASRIGGKSIYDLQKLPLERLRPWADAFEFDDEARRSASRRLLVEIRARLAYLVEVGLGYLSLDRQTRTLSGGEAQRINLATALGSALTDTLYVLDEPTVGLHPRDTHRLIGILQRLRDNGNTVVVVEHDKDVMRGADLLLDIGPGAGERGGELTFSGTPAELERTGAGNTAEFLRREAQADIKRGDALRKPTGWIEVRGARSNNLAYIDARFPLGVFGVVTGPSGSGKTTLVRDTLYHAWRRVAEQAAVDVGDHDELVGREEVAQMTFVDQTPIGRSTRSNAVTYTKAYDEIRKLMARSPEARRLGRTEGDFSFNVRGGRCDVCEGTGVVTVDLHFLGELTVPCDACNGRRFKDFMLAIRHNGKNVAEILDLTVTEAVEFFRSESTVSRALQPLLDAGLGYLRLGQSTATLSGGELQRLKLAAYITGGRPREPHLMIFDEPTTGLHPADLHQLLKAFERLVDTGYSLLVIEHNLDLIARADWIIDLGPEAGEHGGKLVYAGEPAGLLDVAESQTGRFLKRMVTRA